MNIAPTGGKLRQDLDKLLHNYAPGSSEHKRAHLSDSICVLFQAHHDAKGDVVVSKNEKGEIIAVTRQDSDYHVLETIALPGLTPEQKKSFADANAIFPRKTPE